MAAAAILDFPIVLIFNSRNGQKNRTAPACQILLKSVERGQDMFFFRFLTMAAAAILDFQNFKFLTAWTVKVWDFNNFMF